MDTKSQSAFVRMFGDSKWYAGAVKKLAVFDLLLHKVSRGRMGLLTMAGFPNLMLTTTGRKTGARRSVCLLYVPRGDDYVVVASNMGQSEHPAWSANLLADPHADVLERGRTVQVNAQYVTGDSRAAIWRHVVASWPDYETYAERAGNRELRIFVLSKVAETGNRPA
jgi:deazaflavin-dependent oxidoreductase (nitroreductase family)